MKIKTIITGILLLFVGISIAHLVISEFQRDQTAAQTSNRPAIEVAPAVDANDDGSQESDEPEHKVIAYYFHGTQRCVTCRTIETYTEESLKTNFPEELEKGTLEWRAVNIEEPEYEHFIGDYELSTRSVILVEIHNGNPNRWKNLDKVWELVRDKPAFIAYVEKEIKNFPVE